MANDNVLCPLINQQIEAADCIFVSDCVDGMIKITAMPDIYKQIDNYKDICKNCKWHNY